MAANKANKTHIRTMNQKREANKEDKGLMSIAEVRMLLYIVPIATVLALLVYFFTR
jgi:hypothetical protein